MRDRDIFPVFGYQLHYEFSGKAKRKYNGLGKKINTLNIYNPVSSKYTYIASDARRISFKATVSTSEDQVIVAPGYLQKEWIEDGRYFAQYATEAPW